MELFKKINKSHFFLDNALKFGRKKLSQKNLGYFQKSFAIK
eukprot:UN07413